MRRLIYITGLLLLRMIPSVFPTFTQEKKILKFPFLTATIAWKSQDDTEKFCEDDGNSGGFSFEFIMDSSDCELDQAIRFVHRTFNMVDLAYFLKALRHIYKIKGGLENI